MQFVCIHQREKICVFSSSIKKTKKNVNYPIEFYKEKNMHLNGNNIIMIMT